MIEAHTVLPEPEEWVDTIILDADARHRRRIKLVSDGGIDFLLHLAQTTFLRAGDGLQLSDGRVIKVVAKPEPLYRVTGTSATHLLVLAWHIGNRHLKAEVSESEILIRPDPVIKDMLTGLGGQVQETEAPFNPLQGAYDHGHGHHS